MRKIRRRIFLNLALRQHFTTVLGACPLHPPGGRTAEAVITWHGDLIRSYAVQAASEKITRLANETITMLREKREKVQKEDGSIAARAVIARMGKAELRTDATRREQVIGLLVTHRHLIPVARKGHYMMMVPHV